ncbi:TPA: hypothetical protein ACGB1E_005124 [Citrobacter amalonaticus]
MNNDISERINNANHMLIEFSLNPMDNDTNYLLGRILDDINDIDISKPEFSKSDHNEYRLSLLVLHLKILSEFDKYYIPSYKPKKNFQLHLLPPEGSIDGPVMGKIDPADIKDNRLRALYEDELIENEKIGKNISLQSELLNLKTKLSIYNNKLAVISDSVYFIKNNYKNNDLDHPEITTSINEIITNHSQKKYMLSVIKK